MESTPRMCGTTPGSSARFSAAGCMASCCARRKPPTRCGRSWNPAAIRTTRLASIPRSRRRWHGWRERYERRTAGPTPPVASCLASARGGRGSETTAAPIWGLSTEQYLACCDPWPLNPKGELLLGVKLESPEGVANCEEILAVPGLGFAEIGPGDLSLSLGYATIPREPYPQEMQTARDRILAACRKNGIAFLQGCTADNVIARIDEGVRVIAGHSEASAIKGRAYQKRKLPV